jgi:diguanylate cyclase (GGDEF)-like protein
LGKSKPILVGQNLLFKAGAELISSIFQLNENSSALIHLPREAEDQTRSKLGIPEKLSSSEFYYITRNDDLSISQQSLGSLPALSKLRREYFVLLIGSSTSILLLSKAPAERSKAWQTLFINSAQDISHISAQLASRIKTSDLKANETFGKINFAISSHGSATPDIDFHDILNAFLTEIGKNLEPHNRRLENELRWTRTLNLIQSAVGWELDGSRLNNMIARVMKQSVGYDYLELQLLQQSEQKFQIVSSFQHNSTSFGGSLLTVILRPDKQEELLHSRKSVILNRTNVNDWLMNPRLMSMMELESAALIPLIYLRRPNGLLKLFSKQHNHFTPEEAAKLEKIGRIIAKSLENARIHALMHRMATMDGLTNVFNHRFFAEQIIREFKRAQRYKNRLSLLMIDIDFFKQYNDNNGHLQGDAVLTTIGKLLKTNVREVDLVCRYGGEEFVVILPETEIAQAIIVAEKIRVAIEEFPFKSEQRQPNGKVTISAGIAEGVEEIESPTELINRADLALYRAKKLGRNRCEVY